MMQGNVMDAKGYVQRLSLMCGSAIVIACICCCCAGARSGREGALLPSVVAAFIQANGCLPRSQWKKDRRQTTRYYKDQ